MAGNPQKTGSFLDDVAFDRGLKLSDGRFVHNYKELLEGIRLLNDEEFSRHVNKAGDEIAEWISMNQRDGELLARLKGVTGRTRYASAIEKRIRELEKEAGTKQRGAGQQNLGQGNQGAAQDETEGLRGSRNRLWVLVVILFIVIAFEYAYFSTKDGMRQDEMGALRTDIIDSGLKNAQLQQELVDAQQENAALKQDAQARDENGNSYAQNSTLNDTFQHVDPAGPRDRIRESGITVTGSKVIVEIGNPVLATFYDTKSMLPVLTSTAHAIEIVPGSPAEIGVGDIVSYETAGGETVVHRVVEVGTDEDGWYAILKGDNNMSNDKGRVRFSQVRRVVVGVLY